MLQFTHEHGPSELNLMLEVGVLTGARIATITTLGVMDIENAFPDVQMAEIYRVRVGPGTNVKTKGNVSGELLVPKFLIEKLKV